MVIINGELLDAQYYESHVLNRSFKYGDGLFETIRVYGGKPLFLEAHLTRLWNGMRMLGIGYASGETAFRDEIGAEVNRLLDANQIEAHGKLRLHVYRGGAGSYLPAEDVCVYLMEASAFKQDSFRQPSAMTLTNYDTILLQNTPLSRFKTANALPYILAARHARMRGFDHAVMLCGKYVSEADSANIFMVKDKTFLTPPLSDACLDGIMRHQIISLCQRLKLTIKEKSIKPSDLLHADEVFLTSSTRGIIPVKGYQDRVYDTTHYPMTSFIQRCFLQYVDAI